MMFASVLWLFDKVVIVLFETGGWFEVGWRKYSLNIIWQVSFYIIPKQTHIPANNKLELRYNDKKNSTK